MTGEPLQPRLPHCAAALGEGRLGVMQLRVIAEIIEQIPDTVAPADRELAEVTLVQHARRYGPTTLNRLGHRILGALDPDGPAPDDSFYTPGAAP